MPSALTTAKDLQAQYANGAAAMAESLACARPAQKDDEGARQWRRVGEAIRELARQEKPLLARR